MADGIDWQKLRDAHGLDPNQLRASGRLSGATNAQEAIRANNDAKLRDSISNYSGTTNSAQSCSGSNGSQQDADTFASQVAQLTGKSVDEIKPLLETIYGKPGQGGKQPGSAFEAACEIQKRSQSGVGCNFDSNSYFGY